MKLVECVPNFSEGRDRDVIDTIAREIEATEGATLLDVDPGADTNRTVVTFIGTPESVAEAAFRAIRKAAELIDMGRHKGAHARLGATDVCPFIPVSGVTMEECVAVARAVGDRVASELGIPVYLYEEAATRPGRRNLATIRKGEYEGLAQKLKDPDWTPDFGESVFNARAGATVIGAREFLVAYNINLNVRDRAPAHDIALTIRETGRAKRDADGNIIRDEKGKAIKVPGLFKCVKAVGWALEEHSLAQVSMNLTNYKVTPPHIVFDKVCELARERGLRVTGSEIVGLVPKEAMLEAGRYFLRKQGKCTGVPEEELIRVAIHSMGLNEIAPFDPQMKILEYRCPSPPRPLIAMTVDAFVRVLSSDAPAPGGGSAAALCGALSTGLSSMVGNLTVGKKGYEEHYKDMDRASVRAQEAMAFFMRAIDDDTAAFNRLMDAFRMRAPDEEERRKKEEAILEACKGATAVPLSVLERCAEAAEIAREAGLKGNKNSLSDAGVAALTALAAAEGAYYNVLINLKEIAKRDPGYMEATLTRAREALEVVQAVSTEVRTLMKEGLTP
jgi:glutamate formiminotransferase/formiminotetrahydrofolate cyclodeaminase